MAEKPYRIIERRRIYGGMQTSGFTQAAIASDKRKQLPFYDKDAPALLTSNDRRKVMTIGRWLFQNCSPVRGALNEISSLAAATVIPQFDGADKTWGEQAESYLYESGRFLDIRGWGFDEATFNRLLILAVLRDGDQFILLTEDGFGEPKIQVIPAHRIGSRGQTEVLSGPFKGYAITDGVIQDNYGRSVGYRVLGDDEKTDKDYSSNDLFPAFDPDYADQVRGFSALGASIIDWQDLAEARRFELMAQKKIASVAIIESNESGEAPLPNLVGAGTPIQGDDSTDVTPIYGEEMLGGETRYFRAGSGSKWEIPSGDRPTLNAREFSDATAREAIHGIGWSWDFSLNPTKMGGGPARIIVAKVNRKLRHVRERILAPVRRRIDGWRIAKAINNGWLPPNPEWFKWSYQFDADLTADEKYSSDVAVQEMKAGFVTLSDICAKRGSYYDDVMNRRESEAEDLLVRAKRISEKHSIPLQQAIVLIRDTTSYTTLTNASAVAADPALEQPGASTF